MMHRRTELLQFFEGYLGQDFPEDYGTWDQGVLAYASEVEPERVQFVKGQIQKLLEAPDPHKSTETMFKEIHHSGYHPWADYSDARQWLRRLIELLDEGLAKQKPPTESATRQG